MITINLSWADFKASKTAHEFSIYYVAAKGNYYVYGFIATDKFCVQAIISSETDMADFDDNHKETARSIT